ncbi:Uncharacterised protein [Sphingobacterium mizutaii]|uniref:Uncharacterized protein n=1 Tax=Sphingobacterium mizutaii TaxID=1010 RepID=A0AAJ4XFC1_9SPHI|nr:hypothetical protein [Sphingobacterium mizutaii]SDL53933.1 hypothetical protein SAMN05192578_104303 [Sphingobacterium mizutaii]SNV63294.1 Uncharacterised protein [Sphingobacterium mizutaii]
MSRKDMRTGKANSLEFLDQLIAVRRSQLLVALRYNGIYRHVYFDQIVWILFSATMKALASDLP